jgi:hypothetical protein
MHYFRLAGCFLVLLLGILIFFLIHGRQLTHFFLLLLYFNILYLLLFIRLLIILELSLQRSYLAILGPNLIVQLRKFLLSLFVLFRFTRKLLLDPFVFFLFVLDFLLEFR